MRLISWAAARLPRSGFGALDSFAGAVARDPEDNGPTPCGQWLLRDLLAHIVGQYYGFALAASGQPADPRRGPYPAPMAIGFHFVDEVVHAWDLAKSIGAPIEFDDEVLETALSISAQVPNDPATRGDGLAFALGVGSDPDTPTLNRIVTLLGRRPDWTPAH